MAKVIGNILKLLYKKGISGNKSVITYIADDISRQELFKPILADVESDKGFKGNGKKG